MIKMDEISFILSLLALGFTVISFILLWRRDKKYKTWEVDIYTFRRNQNPQHHRLIKEYAPSILEVIANANEDGHIVCKLTEISDLKDLHSDRIYEYIFIRNTSQNAIELCTFEMNTDKDVSINHIIVAGESVLMAIHSINKPSRLIINCRGVALYYSTKSSVGFLRPTEDR